MRILGEGGADAPSSGQDGARGSVRRSGRFRPLRHFPSHSHQGTAGKSACTGPTGASQGVPYPEFPGECRSEATNATPSRQRAARFGATAHRGGASPTHRVHPPVQVRSVDAGRHGAGRGRVRDRSGTPAGPPRERAPKHTGALPGAFYARPPPERLFSANFSSLDVRWTFRPLTPLPPAVLRCRATRKPVSGAPAARGVLPSGLLEVKRFVIECFTPRCLVDLASDGELVTNAPPDTVDLILVASRGRTCRTEGTTRRYEGGLSSMSQESSSGTATDTPSQAPSASPRAIRKLSARRRPEVVAVLLFSGGPIFESSIPLSVFGIDRQDAGVPRYRLLVCAGEEGPLRTTGGLELTAPYGLEALSRAGTVVVPTWRSISQAPPPRRSTRSAGPTRRAPGSSACARVPSCSPPPGCWTAARRPRTGCTRPRSPSATRPCTSTRGSCSWTTVTC